ncbi:MAG: glycosyltransferase family 4 protein [bacterium]
MEKNRSKHEPRSFLKNDRPHICLITNHGFGGVNIPIGGAPDTGGQNVYVNAYAEALDRLGYKVTIYARGGFAFYEEEKLREGEEYLTEHVRYVYVPGGGDHFIRKEDISVALIEQMEWIYDHMNREGDELGCFPWQVCEAINTHYWDAGILGVSLVSRWQNDICSRMITRLLEGAVSHKALEKFHKDRHFYFISSAPDFYIGKLLLEEAGSEHYVNKEEVMLKAYQKWSETSPLADPVDEHIDKNIDWLNLRSTIAAETMQLRPLILAKVLGTALLDQEIKPAIYKDEAFKRYRVYDDMMTYNDLLARALDSVNRHAWTPHSLGIIKERNFRNKPKEINRELKFRERRSHERVICDYSPAFAATSYEIAESLVTNLGVNIDDVLFFPPGVDTRIFREYTEEEMKGLYQYLKDETGVEPERVKSSVVYFETSRMDFTKRKDVLLKAFIEMERNEKALLFIGGGPENDVFASLSEILGQQVEIRDRVFLLGFIPDEFLPMLFSLCDVYVSASEMEGFGMSVAQAAIIGKPVVSSNKIPFSNFYLEEEAIIVQAGDVKGFARGMGKLLTDGEKRKNMGESSREKAMGLDWENLTRNFIVHLNKKNFDIPITEQVSQKLI